MEPKARLAPVRAPGLGFIVGKLARRISWSLAYRTASKGVTPAQFPVLRVLSQHERATQMELARICGMEQPSMAATLSRMEKNGLIDRRPDEEDARKQNVTLTAHGRAMLDFMTRHAHDVYDEAVEGLTNEQIEMFLAICAHMTENLERVREQRESPGNS